MERRIIPLPSLSDQDEDGSDVSVQTSNYNIRSLDSTAPEEYFHRSTHM